MLQQQEDAIIAAAMQAVWTQVQLWSQSNPVGQIQPSVGHSTKYRFIWPEPQAQISQRFGPSTFWFEPPYNGYAHFHTGIDLVEKLGSPVYAADDGIVALVGSSGSGYGTYVACHTGSARRAREIDRKLDRSPSTFRASDQPEAGGPLSLSAAWRALGVQRLTASFRPDPEGHVSAPR